MARLASPLTSISQQAKIKRHSNHNNPNNQKQQANGLFSSAEGLWEDIHSQRSYLESLIRKQQLHSSFLFDLPTILKRTQLGLEDEGESLIDIYEGSKVKLFTSIFPEHEWREYNNNNNNYNNQNHNLNNNRKSITSLIQNTNNNKIRNYHTGNPTKDVFPTSHSNVIRGGENPQTVSSNPPSSASLFAHFHKKSKTFWTIKANRKKFLDLVKKELGINQVIFKRMRIIMIEIWE